MNKDSHIYVAGSTGLVGSAVVRALEYQGFRNLFTFERIDLDLLVPDEVEGMFESCAPEYVFLCAARVGGILANSTKPAEFIYENLQIQNNVIHAAHKYGVKKLLFLGSSCIYPSNYARPIKESDLLSGPLEKTNEWYSIAKIAGIKMCQAYRQQFGSDFISVMPTNLYGPGDNYELDSCHVIPALIRKFHEATIKNLPEVQVWGTGHARREFLFVDDLADALIFLMQNYSSPEIINVGAGDNLAAPADAELYPMEFPFQDIEIKELVEKIRVLAGYPGKVEWDNKKPNGTFRKILDCSKLNKLGWKATTTLDQGLALTYEDFVKRFTPSTSPHLKTQLRTKNSTDLWF